MPPIANHPATRFGRSRLGGGTAALLTGSVFLGAVATAVFIAGYHHFHAPEPLWRAAVVFTALIFPLTAVLAWVILVDRTSIRGALANPEESVEATWYRRAAAGTFQDVLLVGGLTLVALTLTGFELSATALLLILIVLAMADFLARHSLTKRAES